MIQEKITADIKEALKAHDSDRAGALRFLVAQLHNREIDKRGKGDATPLTDDEVIDVLRKEAKKRREAADLFLQGGNQEAVQKEEQELALIQTYLPATPSEEDIRKVVSELKAQGMTEFPQLMKESMARLKGVDGALVSKIVKES